MGLMVRRKRGEAFLAFVPPSHLETELTVRIKRISAHSREVELVVEADASIQLLREELLIDEPCDFIKRDAGVECESEGPGLDGGLPDGGTTKRERRYRR